MVQLSDRLPAVIGEKSAKSFDKAFGIETVGELLLHAPRRYAQRGELSDLRSLNIGDDVTVLAEVADIKNRPMKNRKGSILDVTVTDGTVAGDGAGPRTMIPRIANVVLASSDSVAIDAISARIMGYEETVLPKLENAILAGHDVVFLGERGQAKTRLIRSMVAGYSARPPSFRSRCARRSRACSDCRRRRFA